MWAKSKGSPFYDILLFKCDLARKLCVSILYSCILFINIFIQLRRATIQHPVTGNLEFANYRISKRFVYIAE